jgi:hypothetical protein
MFGLQPVRAPGAARGGHDRVPDVRGAAAGVGAAVGQRAGLRFQLVSSWGVRGWARGVVRTPSPPRARSASYWWTNVPFVNTLYPDPFAGNFNSDECAGWTWYLAV